MFNKIKKGLVQRFFITYIFAIMIPIMFFSYVLYSYNISQNRTEYTNAKRDLLISNRAYVEMQFYSVEKSYNPYNISSGLTNILNHSIESDRDLIYTYVSEFIKLMSDTKNSNIHIDDIRVYTTNKNASEILPKFFDIELFYEKFRDDEVLFRSLEQDLSRKFWYISEETDHTELKYYAGIIDKSNLNIIGIIEFECDTELIESMLSFSDNLGTSYIFLNNQLVHKKNEDQAYDSFVIDNKNMILNNSSGTSVEIMPDKNILLSSMHFSMQNIDVVFASKLSNENSFIEPFNNTILQAFLFLIPSLLLFPTVFKPLRNLSKLSHHMRETKTHKLTQYEGFISNDEVGDLIKDYNELVERTSVMSEQIHDNEILLRNAQIDALQAQLNPHFFYGTIESIRMIAEAHQEDLISDIAYSFGSLMRYSLSREYMVSLSKEIDIVKQYISIQKKRLPNRFELDWKISTAVDEWQCPKFVLFSMVENVFVHNISNTRKVIDIVVNIYEEDDDLVIDVINDGPGIDINRLKEIQYLMEHPDERDTLSTQNNGRSIFNINDRLQLYYGSEYKFSISSTENIQTRCSVRINRNVKVSI